MKQNCTSTKESSTFRGRPPRFRGPTTKFKAVKRRIVLFQDTSTYYPQHLDTLYPLLGWAITVRDEMSSTQTPSRPQYRRLTLHLQTTRQWPTSSFDFKNHFYHRQWKRSSRSLVAPNTSPATGVSSNYHGVGNFGFQSCEESSTASSGIGGSSLVRYL